MGSGRFKHNRRAQANRPKGDDGPGGKYDGTFIQDYEFVKGSGDLDECNGRKGVTPEYPDGTYYYVVTDAFPFIPRFYRGTPDSSFERRMGPPPGGKPPDPRLIDLLAELKMLRSLQMTVNKRTIDYSRQYQGEQADEPQVQKELQGLAQRQVKIEKATKNIATGRAGGGQQ